MLETLFIKNYALIDEFFVKFQNGFNVISGETGAGKSIMLGGLSLILGQRADTSILNNPEIKCIIEGKFKIEINNHLKTNPIIGKTFVIIYKFYLLFLTSKFCFPFVYILSLFYKKKIAILKEAK